MVNWSINGEKVLEGLILPISSENLSYVTNRIRYNINVMRQSACLAINPIIVVSFASLCNCTPVDHADSVMGPTYSLLIYLSWLVLDLVFSVVWSFWVQLVVFR